MFVSTTNVGFAQRVVAILVACAVLLWSIGVYSTVQAANLTTISDTLSDSDVSVVSDHTITFTPPNGVASGQTIVIDFSDGPFVAGAIDSGDVDIATTTDYSIAAACGAADVSAVWGAGPTLTLEMCAAAGQNIPANATTTIEIGLNASTDAAGDVQLTNPAAGSYEIIVTAGADTGKTRVAIIDNVTVSAIVETSFDFTITGTATSTPANGTSTTGSTTATEIPFGVLVAGGIKTLSQVLNVQTNAINGYVVTVEQDGNLQSITGADIDGFRDGTYVDTPEAWGASPINTLLDENTWGHWGLTTSDGDLQGAGIDFGSDEWVAASTTPRAIMAHDGPSDGVAGSLTAVGDDVGSTTVAYQIEITALQEAADDYETTLTYIATPTF